MIFGFSSRIFPAWDVTALLEQAVRHSFSAVELAETAGPQPEPVISSILTDPDGAARQAREAGVAWAAITIPVSLAHLSRPQLNHLTVKIDQRIALAKRIGCPTVALSVTERNRVSEEVLGKLVRLLSDLTSCAEQAGVALAVGNGDGTLGSRDLWYILDAVNHAAVQAAWNPTVASAGGEPDSVSIPRLSARLALVQLSDVRTEDAGQHTCPPGEGSVNLAELLDRLRGVDYRGAVIYAGQRTADDPAQADAELHREKEWFNLAVQQLEAVKELTAYKGDRNAPKYGPSARKVKQS